MANDEQMQIEWRKLVTDTLARIEAAQKETQKDITDIKLNYASNSVVTPIREDVDTLKVYRAKVAGIIFAINTVAVVVGWILESYIASKH